jgi:DNA-binding transcriptional MocR family regulator
MTEANDFLTTTWSRRMQRHTGPLYLSIVEALSEAIREGEVQEGDRLPPQRQLAAGLQVDLTTVTRAFTEARRRGLVDATVGRGSFVRVGAAALRWRADGRSVMDMTMNMPPALSEPSLERMVQEGLARLIKRQDVHLLMSYRVTAGSPEERTAGATWLEPLIGPRDAGEILVAPGAQSAMTAVLTTMTRPGDTVVAEFCTYPGIRALAAQFGLVLAGVEMDAEGMVPEALHDVCGRIHPKLIYCTPSIQNPTTATMSLARRHEILTVARRHGVMILEDELAGAGGVGTAAGVSCGDDGENAVAGAAHGVHRRTGAGSCHAGHGCFAGNLADHAGSARRPDGAMDPRRPGQCGAACDPHRSHSAADAGA